MNVGDATNVVVPARVFVVMPFRQAHSAHMRNVIQSVCKATELDTRIADEPIDPTASLRLDIMEHLHQAEIVIVDLSGLNANVAYELGVARVLGKQLLLLHPASQSLPRMLRGMVAIPYGDLDDPQARRTLTDKLQQHLKKVQARLFPEMFQTVRDRTTRIIQDLEALAHLPHVMLRRQTVWISAFLSSFALDRLEGYEESELDSRELLWMEKQRLVELAQKGCRIVCIISPPEPDPRKSLPSRIALPRVRCLLEFLQSGQPALGQIDWVLSPFWQKSFFIIGNLACYERFQKGTDRGEALTLRQPSQAAIRANTAIYELLFERLAISTLGGPPPSNTVERRERLREATAAKLEEILRKGRALDLMPHSTAPADRPKNGTGQ